MLHGRDERRNTHAQAKFGVLQPDGQARTRSERSARSPLHRVRLLEQAGEATAEGAWSAWAWCADSLRQSEYEPYVSISARSPIHSGCARQESHTRSYPVAAGAYRNITLGYKRKCPQMRKPTGFHRASNSAAIEQPLERCCQGEMGNSRLHLDDHTFSRLQAHSLLLPKKQ